MGTYVGKEERKIPFYIVCSILFFYYLGDRALTREYISHEIFYECN